MLPKMTADGSVEWEIIEPNKDGKFNCLDCNETFESRYR